MEDLIKELLTELKEVKEINQKILDILIFQNSTRKVNLNIDNKMIN